MYLDPKTNKRYKTMLADFKCSKCGSIETGHPENLGSPPECCCANMSMQEVKKMKKDLLKSQRKLRLATT